MTCPVRYAQISDITDVKKSKFCWNFNRSENFDWTFISSVFVPCFFALD